MTSTKQTGRIGIIKGALLALLAFTIVKCTYDQSTKPEPPPPVEKTQEQLKREAEENAKFTLDVAKVRALKSSLKNPASFELVQAGRLDNGTLCVIYRGTNSFNAIVTEQKAVLANGTIGDWNKNCGGKRGEDVSRVKHAL